MFKSIKPAGHSLLLGAALFTTAASAQRVEFFRSDYCAPNSSAFSIASGWDNSFFITGVTTSVQSSNRTSDIVLVKMKPDGDTAWRRTYGDASQHESSYCVLTPQSDQVVLAGLSEDTGSSRRSRAFLASFDASGNLDWMQHYPVPGKRTAVVDMKRLNDGFILCGTITDSITNNTDAWLLKTDLDGNKLWSNNYGGSEYDDAWQVERTPDGGFMLAGGSYSYRTGTRQDDAWLVKTTGTGAQVWIKNYGNADTVDWIWSLAPVGNPAAPSGYVFTGVKNRNPASIESEMFLARVDTGGNILWDVPMPGRLGYREGLSIEPTYHGTYYVTGTELDLTGNMALLAMDIDSNGKVLNELRYNNPQQEWIRPRAMYINNLGDAYVAGQLITPGNRIDLFSARIRDINALPASVGSLVSRATITVFPNPASDYCTVSSEAEDMLRISVRDAAGRTALDIRNPGTRYEKISLAGLTPGFYVVTVYTRGIAPINLRLSIR